VRAITTAGRQRLLTWLFIRVGVMSSTPVEPGIHYESPAFIRPIVDIHQYAGPLWILARTNPSIDGRPDTKTVSSRS
jgi:hypothetical protein